MTVGKKIRVIGGGLTGLSLSHWLSQRGYDVQLLEGSDGLGGHFRGDAPELNVIPPTEEALQALLWLNSVAPIAWSEVERSPIQFEHNEWRPFLGFGDFPSSVVDELAHLNQAKFWSLEPGIAQIVRALAATPPFDVRLRSEVTGFEYKDGRIIAAVINGQERVTGDVFIFTPSAHQLVQLLPADAIKPAHRSRLAKNPGWTSALMTLRHGKPLEAGPEIRFVLGTGREFEPVVGRVWPTHSVWLNLVDGERAENLEHVGDCVRFIKRTIKRIWPEIIDDMASESIRIRPNSYGRLDLKLKDGAFPELPNLLLADARQGTVWGELAAAAMGQRLSTLFVAQPQPTVLSDSEAVQLI